MFFKFHKVAIYDNEINLDHLNLMLLIVENLYFNRMGVYEQYKMIDFRINKIIILIIIIIINY